MFVRSWLYMLNPGQPTQRNTEQSDRPMVPVSQQALFRVLGYKDQPIQFPALPHISIYVWLTEPRSVVRRG